jgi:hypothetical protein
MRFLQEGKQQRGLQPLLPQVYPGAEGRARFEAQIRELIQLEDGEDFDVEFECKAPDTGEVQQVGLLLFRDAAGPRGLGAAEPVDCRMGCCVEHGELQDAGSKVINV